MTKPSHRHSAHVQSAKPAKPDEPADAVPPPPPDPPSMQKDKYQGRYWFALVIWTLVFGFLLLKVLIDLVYSFFWR